MTQEEKAKAYDEAIERAKRIKNGENNWRYSDLSEIIPALEEVLPELKKSEDERIREIITDSVFYQYGAGVEYKDVLDYLDKLEKQKEQKEQKPAEWSKNDTVFLNEITDFFENKTVRLQHDIDMYAHWLKSLPERFNIQPKQEWSEDDEEMIGCIIDDIREAKRNSDKEYFKELCDKEIAWLKSIRPDTFQNGNSRPKSPDNWKPSEEQIEALHTAVYLEEMQFYGGLKDKLRDLYEQLKKL